MANIHLIAYKIKSLDMVNLIAQQGELKITNNFNFNVQYHKTDASQQGYNRAIATLTEIVELQDKPEEFHIVIKLDGSFDIGNVIDDEERKEIHVQCYDELFPYANQIITNLAGNSGMPGLVLRKIPMTTDSVKFGKRP